MCGIFFKSYFPILWPFKAKNRKNSFIFASHSKPIKIYADQNGEFVHHDFKIIYKRFKSSALNLTLGEA